MNKVFMSGRLTKDPVFKTIKTQTGYFNVTNFDLAVRRNASDKSDFFHIKAMNKQAEIARDYLHKGMRVVIEGEFQTSAYPDKETGEKKTAYEINVNRIEFFDTKDGSAMQEGKYPQKAPEGYNGFMDIPEGMEAEMPFR